MPYDASNAEFEAVFGRENADTGIVDSFLGALRRNLRKKDSRASRELLEWMDDGGRLSAFTCRDDVLLGMTEEMGKSDIPYAVIREVTGGSGILIRECDAKKVTSLTGDVLRKCSSYCRVATGQEAEMAYLHSNDEDKMMIQIGGLTEEEALHLEQKCQTAMGGEVIGFDIMPDGTYLFTCHGRTAMGGRNAPLFRQAVSETILLMNGGTSEQSRMHARRAAEYRQNRAMDFPDRSGTMSDPVWVVGDGQYFVKRTKEGFELGHAVELHDDVSLETDMVVSALDRRYRIRLNSALSKITGHTCLYELDAVIEWFKTKRSYLQSAAIEGQKCLASVMDEIVMKKISIDSTMRMKGKWSEKLAHYQKEAAKLLVAVIKHPDRPPKGYTKEDIGRIKKVVQSFDINIYAMQPALSRMAHMETFAKEAGPRRIENFMDHIQELNGQSQGRRMGKDRRDRPGRQGVDTWTR